MSAHKSTLDNLTPAQIRVVCEQLLYTMDIDQRTKLIETFPGLYRKIFPDVVMSATIHTKDGDRKYDISK